MRSSQESSKQPIFIIGAPRSGTTLLRLMLTSHPDICIPPESMFFVQLEPKYGKLENLAEKIDEFLDDLYSNDKFLEWNIDRARLQENLNLYDELNYSKAISTVYQTYRLKTDPNAHIWGDKNPTYIYHIDRIFQYFPNAKIIHIIRDVRAVYSSMKTVSNFPGWGKKQKTQSLIFEVTRVWSQAVQSFNKYNNNHQFYNIHYEKLISNPDNQLNQLCSWLGINFSESMLDYYNKNTQKELVPKHRLSWHQNTLKPILEDRIEAWANELSLSEIEALEILNKNNLKILGYKCSSKFFPIRGFIQLGLEKVSNTRNKPK
jgi:hypothetical protein